MATKFDAATGKRKYGPGRARTEKKLSAKRRRREFRQGTFVSEKDLMSLRYAREV